jgi:hypothetical protein
VPLLSLKCSRKSSVGIEIGCALYYQSFRVPFKVDAENDFFSITAASYTMDTRALSPREKRVEV